MTCLCSSSVIYFWVFEWVKEWRKDSDRLQLLETSVGNVIRFRKRRIMTKCGSLHFCLLDPPVFQCHVSRLPCLRGSWHRVIIWLFFSQDSFLYNLLVVIYDKKFLTHIWISMYGLTSSKTKGYFQLKIIANVLISSFHLFWTCWIPMIWVHDHYTYFYSYSAGIDFKRQNLTSTDIRSPCCKG